jgi:hypothetical protein
VKTTVLSEFSNVKPPSARKARRQINPAKIFWLGQILNAVVFLCGSYDLPKLQSEL